MPASPYSSVQQARKSVAERLVEIRKDAGIPTSRAMAERLGWYESKVSRVVNGVTPPSEADVRAWCVECSAEDEIPELIALLRTAEGAYIEWRRMERAGLRAAQEQVLPLYERTEHFRAYSPNLVPGLIQVRTYTAAVLRATQLRRGLVDDVEEAVQVRMDRQHLLHEPGKTFVFVLEETVLRNRVADNEAMGDQLGHLLQMMARPNISLGIIPLGVPRDRYGPEGFRLHDASQASIELVGAYLTVTQRREIALYEQAFTDLSALAVHGSAARKLIAAAVDALG